MKPDTFLSTRAGRSTDHAESYNPPAEYLFSAEELQKWEDLDPEDRKYNFIPQK